MKVYADSSVLIAWFHPDDEFARSVGAWCSRHVTDFHWNSILRLEVRHNLRQLSTPYARTAWNAFRAAEQTRLKLGRERLQHLLDDADELSSRHAQSVVAGTWDYFHVAAALQLRAESFVTCDRLQADLARRVRLPKVKLFRIS